MNHIMKIISASALLIGMLMPMQAHAVTNGSFETGDLTGWVLEQGNAEVVNPSMFNANAPLPSDGYSMLLLSSGGSGPALGLDPYTDMDGDGINEFDVAIVSQTFTAPGSGVLTFNAKRLTSEGTNDPDFYDPAGCYVDVYTNIIYGTITSMDPYTGGIPNPYAGTFVFAGTFDPYAATTVVSPGLTNGSAFNVGQTAYATVSTTLAAGTHKLVCMQGDVGDGGVDSGLIIDNVVFTVGGGAGGGGGCAIDPSAGFDPLLPVLALLALGFFYRRRFNR